jgi:hypothetical protein
LLEDFKKLRSIASETAEREGAGQDFESIAILGFAANAGVLSEPGPTALENGLRRLARLRPIANGVRMSFYTDAVGMLGVALGTAVIANAEVTAQVVGWERRFLKSAYERDGVQDWERCLWAAADLKLGVPLKLPVMTSGIEAPYSGALPEHRSPLELFAFGFISITAPSTYDAGCLFLRSVKSGARSQLLSQVEGRPWPISNKRQTRRRSYRQPRVGRTA